jgi:excisionase family DNA binding protein
MSDYKIKELAEKLNVSYSKAREIINSGAVASYRIPGTKMVRVPEDEIKKLRGC